MEVRIFCPRCQHVLTVDPAAATDPMACPDCGQLFHLPPAGGDGLGSGEASPGDPPARARRRPGPALAEALGIDLERQAPGVSDGKAATAELKAWKKAVPAVRSAYRPSGALPTSALVHLLLGGLCGAVLGALVAALAAGIGGGLMLLLAGFIGWLADKVNLIWGLPVCLFGFAGLVTAVVTFAGLGGTAALTTVEAGKAGKNRNTAAGVLASMLSAVAGMYLAWVLFQFYGKALLNRKLDVAPGALDTVYAVVALLGGMVAAVTAGLTAAREVQAAKFCEECRIYLQPAPLTTLSLGALEAMAHALRQRDLDAAADLLAAPDGAAGKVELFPCPECGKGFLELTALYKAAWKDTDGDEQTREATWLAGSVELAPPEVARFRAPAGPPADGVPGVS
jgi:hypothetical protein